MRQRPKGSSEKSNSSVSSSVEAINNGKETPLYDNTKNVVVVATRSSYVILALFVLVIYGSWGVYHYQFESLPLPLTLEQVGKRGFSEHEAMKHVEALTQLGPHPVGSVSLDRALQVIYGLEVIN